MNTVTRAWKVYGRDGHRQRESFHRSNWIADNRKEKGYRVVEVLNADITGTNEYSIVRITRPTPEDCMMELYGQISDGCFENSYVGMIEEINPGFELGKSVTTITDFVTIVECFGDSYGFY